MKSVIVGRREYGKASKDSEVQSTEAYPTAPYTTQENGRCEWMSRTIDNGIPTMLIQAGPLAIFWVECFYLAIQARNRVAHPRCGKVLKNFYRV